MELKQYLKIIRQNYKLILIITVLTGLFSFIFSVIQPTKYETSLSLLISKNKTQQTDDFKYDGYYALQASEIMADSVEQWLKSPEVVSAVYQRTGINSDFRNIKSYGKKFTAKKMSSQYVEVKFKTATREEAEKISAAIIKIINDKAEALRKNSEREVSFLISGENPVTVENNPDIFLNLFIGLISGLALGIFIVFGKRYFV